MNDTLGPLLVPLAKNPLIDAAADVAAEVYALLPEFPESEKWETMARVHGSANYLLFNVARAVANPSPTGSEFDWGAARKEAGGLLTMLRFAVKQGFAEQQSDLLLKLNDLIKRIDQEVQAAYARRDAYNQYEMSLWDDKYRLWQKLNREIKA